MMRSRLVSMEWRVGLKIFFVAQYIFFDICHGFLPINIVKGYENIKIQIFINT